jgi:hypothetical protein
VNGNFFNAGYEAGNIAGTVYKDFYPPVSSNLLDEMPCNGTTDP